MKYLIICILLFLSSCSIKQNNHYKQSKQTNKTPALPKSLSTADMIRGVILSQTFDKKQKLWRYNLKVMDIKSSNISNISFLFAKQKYNIGDLVYVLFEKSSKKVARDIYLGRKISKNIENTSRQNPQKKHKRTKAKQKIHLPKTETILLD